MAEILVYSRFLNQAESMLDAAKDAAQGIRISFQNLVSCRRSLVEFKRSLLFIDNGHEDVSDLSSIVEKLHFAMNDFSKCKIKYQTSISIAVSYLVEIIKNVNKEDYAIRFPYPKYRNVLRAIIRLVSSTRGFGVDYSSVVAKVASTYAFLSFCDKSDDIDGVSRLFKILLETISE